jgi:Zn-finger nucleic acid-binding protein
MELTCPKCHGAMRQYERSGVVVDQCGECRGIFLDRGELEKLIDAENTWHASAAAPQPPRQQYRDQRYGHDRSYAQSQHYDQSHRPPSEDRRCARPMTAAGRQPMAMSTKREKCS